MSIHRAITRAYNVAMERGHEMIFWCIDLHGTVLESNYSNDSFTFIDNDVVNALQVISSLPETRIILWSGITDEDKASVLELFASQNIRVDWVNENPAVPSCGTGDFTKKFYFSILIDDKAGFSPREWKTVAEYAVYRSQEFNGPPVVTPAKSTQSASASTPGVLDTLLDGIGDLGDAISDIFE